MFYYFIPSGPVTSVSQGVTQGTSKFVNVLPHKTEATVTAEKQTQGTSKFVNVLPHKTKATVTAEKQTQVMNSMVQILPQNISNILEKQIQVRNTFINILPSSVQPSNSTMIPTQRNTLINMLTSSALTSSSSMMTRQDLGNVMQNSVKKVLPDAQAVSQSKKVECEICGKKLSNRSSLLIHQKSIHPVYWSLHKQKTLKTKKKAKFKGLVKDVECDVTFKKNKTSSAPTEKYSCYVCEKKFTTEKICRKHLLKIHGIIPENNNNKKLKCSGCHEVFRTKEIFINHLEQNHNLPIPIEMLDFNNIEDFEKWKKEIERNTLASFAVKNTSKTSTGFRIINYTCHRNGKFISRSTGKRRPRLSNKIDFFCPAFISVLPKQVGETFPAQVKFALTHLGHKCELARLNLSNEEKCEILLEKLKLKRLLYGDSSTCDDDQISVEEILED